MLSRVQLLATPWTVSPPGSSVRGILQVRILEWVAIPFSRGSSKPKDRTQVSRIAGRFFAIRASGEGGAWLVSSLPESRLQEGEKELPFCSAPLDGTGFLVPGMEMRLSPASGAC